MSGGNEPSGHRTYLLCFRGVWAGRPTRVRERVVPSYRAIVQIALEHLGIRAKGAATVSEDERAGNRR
jgi:hypothetical protein